MRGRPSVALWVVGWVVVAVAGATLAWGVISRAGGGVSGGLDTVPAPSTAARTPSGTVTGRTLSPSPTPSPTTPGPSSPSSSDTGSGATVTPVSRTWQGEAGVVAVSCHGPAISLDGATAYSGYVVEEDDAGPDRVRVEFEADESSIRVEAECSGGEPVFSENRSGEG
ncbi:MAG: hypothetical protein ACRDO4_09975 [Nocardioides sp.]